MYSDEEVAAHKAAICEEIANGKSLREILKAETMPASSTVFAWLSADTDFSEQYARAREAQADALFDEILTIADDGSNDWMVRNHGEDEAWVENGESLRRSQLRVDARKWMASKLQPKKYGEKVQQEHSGAVTVTKIELVAGSANSTG